jgi:stalled ribosome rescue protein Dom34
VVEMKSKRGYRRGYAVALFVGVEDDHAVLWQVFSHVVKLHLRVELEGRRTDERALYNFHESVVDALKPVLKEGVRSIVITAPMKTTYTLDFLGHVRKHHAYLLQSKGSNRTVFAELVGSADQPHKVAELVKTKEFRRLIAETTSEEADHIVDALEKQLYSLDNSSVVLYSLREIEGMVYDHEGHNDLGTEYLMLTDKYLADCEDKNRIHRLLQIAKNRKVKTRIVNAKTLAGKRVSQLGGVVFFATPTK